MVLGGLPAAKLFILFIKQMSKPIANAAKERAKTHPFFRKWICMPIAQVYNRGEIKARMWFLNLGKPVNVPELNEAQAIELGANLLGEAIIYGLGVGLIYVEYSRQKSKTLAKEKEDEERMNNLHFTIQELCIQAERSDAQIRELQRKVLELDSSVVKKLWTPNQSSSAEDQSNSSQLGKEKNVITEAIGYIEKDIFNGRDKKATYRSV